MPLHPAEWVEADLDAGRVLLWQGNLQSPSHRILVTEVTCRGFARADMYEHAYHMDYGAAAQKYIDAFMQNVKWEEVNRRYVTAQKIATLRS